MRLVLESLSVLWLLLSPESDSDCFPSRSSLDLGPDHIDCRACILHSKLDMCVDMGMSVLGIGADWCDRMRLCHRFDGYCRFDSCDFLLQ